MKKEENFSWSAEYQGSTTPKPLTAEKLGAASLTAITTLKNPFGSLLAKASAEMKNIPEIREDVVASLKAQIDSGSYNPPLDKVANALYVAGILDAFEE